MSKCPNCKSLNGGREILYGFPTATPNENVVVVGGCSISEFDPLMACIDCGSKWDYEVR